MPNDTTLPTAAAMTETIMVPFNNLAADPENVRKTRSQEGIDALADNILAEGLLQNLIVRKIKGGKFAVVGGERRRQALAVLVKRKAMSKSDEVPVRLIVENATSASLAENIHRMAMHPADQFDAWVRMAEDGLTVDQIAQRHGASVRLVEQRLSLGRLSPVILDAFRADEITLEAAAAFTLTDDHERQSAVYEAIKSHWQGPSAQTVRHYLTQSEVPSTDKRAIFIGQSAYEAAGGEIRTDLFGEDVFLKDAELVQSLAVAKLEAEAETLKAKGWKWIELSFDQDYSATRDLRALPKKGLKAKDRAIAGGFLYLDYDGTLGQKMGYVRPEDDPEQAETRAAAATEKAANPNGYAMSLRDDLAALRLEILQTELLANPMIARDLLTFHMVRDALSRGFKASPFELSAHPAFGRRCASEKGDMGHFEGRERVQNLVADLSMNWLEIEDAAESFDAYRTLSEHEKTALQAYAAAHMLKPQLSDEPEAAATLEHTATIIGVDPAQYWTPGKEFFERLTKAQLGEIAETVVSPEFAQSHGKEKKGAFAEIMGNAFTGEAKSTGLSPDTRERIAAWVPECMATLPKPTE